MDVEYAPVELRGAGAPPFEAALFVRTSRGERQRARHGDHGRRR